MAKPVEKEWTIMFYFASDDPMAPIIVSQLKAITSAGFHQDVNVLCQFDPYTKGTDTHIFDVNGVSKLIYKKERYKFWGKNDPYIRNLVYDKLWNKDAIFPTTKKGIRQSIGKVLRDFYDVNDYDPHEPGKIAVEKPKGDGDKVSTPAEGDRKEPSPMDSLGHFLKFCRESYPARHYALFILGHGLVVGNDMFLSDANSEKSHLSLTDLGEVLSNFTTAPAGRKLDLIGFHSCSMSGIEVAYELHGIANYMLASQGPAFVGSWPYREILFRFFNDVNKKDKWDKTPPEKRREKPPTPESTIKRIFEYVLRYSYDFQLAGYSFDLSMCDLQQIEQVKDPLFDLANTLKADLMKRGVPLVKEAILLAHWDAQSFWQESYTDLYDFCSCLRRRCNDMSKSSPKAATYLRPIAAKCTRVIAVLEKDVRKLSAIERRESKRSRLIVRAAFAGPQYQYSHGLSVYFPWSEPTSDFFWNTEYKTKYAFRETAWHEFLQAYFDQTIRKPIGQEVKLEYPNLKIHPLTIQESLLEEITCKVFNVEGQMNTLAGGKGGSGGGLGPEDEGTKGGSGSGLSKGGSGGGTGGDCDCPSIKNYPTFTRERPGGVYSAKPKERPDLGNRELFEVLISGKKRS